VDGWIGTLFFCVACAAIGGLIGRFIAPIRWGVLGIFLVLAPVLPALGEGNFFSWMMAFFAVAGLFLLAADVGGKLRGRGRAAQS